MVAFFIEEKKKATNVILQSYRCEKDAPSIFKFGRILVMTSAEYIRRFCSILTPNTYMGHILDDPVVFSSIRSNAKFSAILVCDYCFTFIPCKCNATIFYSLQVQIQFWIQAQCFINS